MEKRTSKLIRIICLLNVLTVLSSCLPSDIPSARAVKSSTSTTSGTTDGSVNDGETNILPKVEIRHLVEPNLITDSSYSSGTGYAGGGSYVRKLTLPKNFAGRLYVAGINISTLADRHVKVRFKFGVGRDPIVIPATVVQAPGITPQTNINVLVLDLRAEYFRDVRLPYDLFDYNDYSNSTDPVQDNRDPGLYCRGLRLEDDPTFDGIGACDGNEKCLYSYAKVLDQGLIKGSYSTTSPLRIVGVPTTPSLPQVKTLTGSNYFQDNFSDQISKPLLDISPVIPFSFSQQAVPSTASNSVEVIFNTWGPKTILGNSYFYRGLYRLIDKNSWHYRSETLDQEFGLFKAGSSVNYDPSSAGILPDDSSGTQNKLYFSSYLFPLATKIDLSANVTHLSSSDVFGTRSEQVLSLAGKTLWMDGSNARAMSKNSNLEHIGSCNVSSSIEIMARDTNDVEYIVALANDVKLQLVRPTQYKTDTGNEVLYSNFKTCTSNSTCGGNECCFNSRCWDENLVSQCLDVNQGNREVGQACSSDLQCTSLCCNTTSGLCSPHNTILNPAVLCNKPTGAFCISKEWCQKSTIQKCLVVKTGVDGAGNVTCRQQCYTTQEYGDCKEGVCIPPVQPSIPTFDPTAEGACDNAVPAPSF